MIRAHHAGKMGDLIYALPVLRSLHRTRGEPIHLTTSGLAYQLGPLLEEPHEILRVLGTPGPPKQSELPEAEKPVLRRCPQRIVGAGIPLQAGGADLVGSVGCGVPVRVVEVY